jgi:hypothetical protein
MRRSVFLFLAICFAGAPLSGRQVTAAGQRLDPAPLFATQRMLDLTIEAPLSQLRRDRGENRPFRPAVLRYTTGDGTERELRIALRARGNFRLQQGTCDFPSFFLRVDDPASSETLFSRQSVVPLLAHCRTDRREYEQFVLLEYLIYRTYAVLTDRSLEARLARITYLDTEGRNAPITRYAVFTEHFDHLAARLGWEVLQIPVVPPDQVAPFDLARFEVFQYFIGNTDFDPFHAEPGEDACCHNAVLIGTMVGPVIPVPFDFDWSGVVDPPYARPDPRFGIRSVRERRYWGICRPREELEAVFALFRDRRDDIYALFRNLESLEPRYRDRTLEYFDQFYTIIGDERRVAREIEGRCRGWR